MYRSILEQNNSLHIFEESLLIIEFSDRIYFLRKTSLRSKWSFGYQTMRPNGWPANGGESIHPMGSSGRYVAYSDVPINQPIGKIKRVKRMTNCRGVSGRFKTFNKRLLAFSVCSFEALYYIIFLLLAERYILKRKKSFIKPVCTCLVRLSVSQRGEEKPP